MKKLLGLLILVSAVTIGYAQEVKVGNIWKYAADFLVENGELKATDQLEPVLEADGQVALDFCIWQFLSVEEPVLPEYIDYDIPLQEELLIYSFSAKKVPITTHSMLVKRGAIGFVNTAQKPEDILKDICYYSIKHDLTRDEILEVLNFVSRTLKFDHIQQEWQSCMKKPVSANN